MKKLLLSLGALSAVVAPVAAVVACGSKTETPAKPETPGTADALAGMKTTDLATAETLTLSDHARQGLIDHINGATTLEELTGYMDDATTASTNAIAAANAAAEAKTKEVAKQVKLGENQKVFVLGFTFGVKATDLNADQTDFTQEFKDLLAEAGVANTKPVSDSIRSDLLDREKAAGFIKVAGSGIDVISTDGAIPTGADEEAIIKAQLKLAGISRIFGHVQINAAPFKEETVAAKAAVTDDTFTTPNNFAVVNNLKAIKFVA